MRSTEDKFQRALKPATAPTHDHRRDHIPAISSSIVSKRKDLALSAGEIAALAEVRNSNARP